MASDKPVGPHEPAQAARNDPLSEQAIRALSERPPKGLAAQAQKDIVTAAKFPTLAEGIKRALSFRPAEWQWIGDGMGDYTATVPTIYGPNEFKLDKNTGEITQFTLAREGGEQKTYVRDGDGWREKGGRLYEGMRKAGEFVGLGGYIPEEKLWPGTSPRLADDGTFSLIGNHPNDKDARSWHSNGVYESSTNQGYAVRLPGAAQIIMSIHNGKPSVRYYPPRNPEQALVHGLALSLALSDEDQARLKRGPLGERFPDLFPNASTSKEERLPPAEAKAASIQNRAAAEDFKTRTFGHTARASGYLTGLLDTIGKPTRSSLEQKKPLMSYDLEQELAARKGIRDGVAWLNEHPSAKPEIDAQGNYNQDAKDLFESMLKNGNQGAMIESSYKESIEQARGHLLRCIKLGPEQYAAERAALEKHSLIDWSTPQDLASGKPLTVRQASNVVNGRFLNRDDVAKAVIGFAQDTEKPVTWQLEYNGPKVDLQPVDTLEQAKAKLDQMSEQARKEYEETPETKARMLAENLSYASFYRGSGRHSEEQWNRDYNAELRRLQTIQNEIKRLLVEKHGVQPSELDDVMKASNKHLGRGRDFNSVETAQQWLEKKENREKLGVKTQESSDLKPTTAGQAAAREFSEAQREAPGGAGVTEAPLPHRSNQEMLGLWNRAVEANGGKPLFVTKGYYEVGIKQVPEKTKPDDPDGLIFSNNESLMTVKNDVEVKYADGTSETIRAGTTLPNGFRISPRHMSASGETRTMDGATLIQTSPFGDVVKQGEISGNLVVENGQYAKPGKYVVSRPTIDVDSGRPTVNTYTSKLDYWVPVEGKPGIYAPNLNTAPHTAVIQIPEGEQGTFDAGYGGIAPFKPGDLIRRGEELQPDGTKLYKWYRISLADSLETYRPALKTQDTSGGVDEVTQNQLDKSAEALKQKYPNLEITRAASTKEEFDANAVRSIFKTAQEVASGTADNTKLQDILSRNLDRLNDVDPRIIYDGMTDVLMSDKPSKTLEVLKESGFLKKILPAVTALEGLEQDVRHHPENDTWKHIMKVVDNAAQEKGLNGAQRKALMWAALLHDTGMRDTQQITPVDGQPPRITFFKHDAIGAEKVDLILEKLQAPKEERELARDLTAEHMNMHLGLKDSKVRALMEKHGPDYAVFVALQKADALGRDVHTQEQYEQLGLAARGLPRPVDGDGKPLTADEYWKKSVRTDALNEQELRIKQQMRAEQITNEFKRLLTEKYGVEPGKKLGEVMKASKEHLAGFTSSEDAAKWLEDVGHRKAIGVPEVGKRSTSDTALSELQAEMMEKGLSIYRSSPTIINMPPARLHGKNISIPEAFKYAVEYGQKMNVPVTLSAYGTDFAITGDTDPLDILRRGLGNMHLEQIGEGLTDFWNDGDSEVGLEQMDRVHKKIVQPYIYRLLDQDLNPDRLRELAREIQTRHGSDINNELWVDYERASDRLEDAAREYEQQLMEGAKFLSGLAKPSGRGGAANKEVENLKALTDGDLEKTNEGLLRLSEVATNVLARFHELDAGEVEAMVEDPERWSRESKVGKELRKEIAGITDLDERRTLRERLENWFKSTPESAQPKRGGTGIGSAYVVGVTENWIKAVVEQVIP